VSNDVVADSHQSVQLGRNGGASFEVHKDVVPFLQAIDFVGELSLVPLCGGFDDSTLLLNDVLESVGDLLHFGVGEVWSNNVKSFVFAVCHAVCVGPFGVRAFGGLRLSTESLAAIEQGTPS